MAAAIASAAMAAVGASDRWSPEANSATRRAPVLVCQAGVPGWVVAGPGSPPGAITSLQARAWGGAPRRSRSSGSRACDARALAVGRGGPFGRRGPAHLAGLGGAVRPGGPVPEP